MDKLTFITAVFGSVFGVLGATLGIINTWRAFDRDRVRLIVRPLWMLFPNKTHTLCIEVINKGYVPVTVTQVGLTMRDKQKSFIFDVVQPGDSLPKRLEPRTAVTFVAPSGTENDPRFSEVRAAFARTACECRFIGTSAALRAAISNARAVRLPTIPK